MAQQTEQYAPLWEGFELLQLMNAVGKQQDVDIYRLLAEVEIPVQPGEALADTLTWVTLEQESQLYALIANVNQDPMLAFNHGKAMSIVQCGVLGQTMQSCESLLSAVQVMERYASLFSWKTHFRLHQITYEKQAAASLVMIPCPLDECSNIFEVESTFAIIRRIFHEILLEPPKLLAVHFKHRVHPDVKAAFSQFMACPIKDNAATNEIVISMETMNRRLPYGDAAIKEMLLTLCQKELQGLEQHTSLLWQVSHFLETCEHPTNIEKCAAHFCLSSRTLRRRLKQYGTSFQALLDQYRFERAKQHLVGSQVCLDVLARELGFSEVRSFRVAFKRWSGLTPSAFRQQRFEEIQN